MKILNYHKKIMYNFPPLRIFWILASCSCLISISALQAQSIAEKKAALESSSSDLDAESEAYLKIFNEEMLASENQLKALYATVQQMYADNAPEEDYKGILDQINLLKSKRTAMENTWRDKVSRISTDETYGLWLAPETNLEQLVIDYGSQDYVYLIPAEIGGIKLSVDSNLPIPRASWGQMLEQILAQNGVGIRALNPYLRQLYSLKTNNSVLKALTNNRQELDIWPADTRIGFVLSPPASEVRRAYVFLQKFSDSNTTSISLIGRDVLIVGFVSDIQDLLKLNDFVAANRGDKEHRLIPLFRIQAGEMAKILQAVFDHEEEAPVVMDSNKEGTAQAGTTVTSLNDNNGLKIVSLESMAQALFLVGTKEEIKHAEEVIRNVESQLSGAREKVVFWYTARHSDAEELAEVLQRIYWLMSSTGTGMEQQGEIPQTNMNNDQNVNITQRPERLSSQLLYQDTYYQQGAFVVNPAPVQPGMPREKSVNDDRDNFIVDMKTGSIVMVVEADIIPKIKELIRKLDVPKKMVQIETLLFEKRVTHDTSYGLNLLRVGSAATQTHATSLLFNNAPPPLGILEFLMSRKKTDSGIPAFDLAYRFLLSQDDIQLNACPTVLAVNQTPATIAIVEEISINTGVFVVETATPQLEKAFTRSQYGININIIPTIHMSDEESDCDDDGINYVTLDTDINFDSILPSEDPKQPRVARRNIKNQVLIPDGQTVIIGGLRRKEINDNRDAIPFIGELPGIGKLFSLTNLHDSSTEMFIFITPKIVTDPVDDLERLRCEMLSRRPGDLPCFLARLQEARLREKFALMHNSMTILFSHKLDGYYDADEDQECYYYDGEYDGR